VTGPARAALVPTGHSKPVGRYSPGIAVPVRGPLTLVFLSGQVSTDEHGRLLCPGDAGGQAEVAFRRLEAVLATRGGRLADLVAVTVFLVDVERDFAAVSAVRNRVLADPPPASTVVQVARLVEDGCLVEINATAVLP
jgi:enamine deaminase RidA (YjgF/YER057c/UK114 family)